MSGIRQKQACTVRPSTEAPCRAECLRCSDTEWQSVTDARCSEKNARSPIVGRHKDGVTRPDVGADCSLFLEFISKIITTIRYATNIQLEAKFRLIKWHCMRQLHLHHHHIIINHHHHHHHYTSPAPPSTTYIFTQKNHFFTFANFSLVLCLHAENIKTKKNH